MFKRLFWLCFLPIVAGALVYLLFRKGVWISDIITSANKIAVHNKLLAVLIEAAPDFLWSFSFANFLFTYKITSKSYYNYLVLMVLLLAEIIQLFFGHFTFDYFDLLAAFLAWAVSLKLKTLYYEK